MKEEARKDYEAYCERIAKSRNMSIEEVKKLKVVEEYKEYIEREHDGKQY